MLYKVETRFNEKFFPVLDRFVIYRIGVNFDEKLRARGEARNVIGGGII